jgi:hypothetical protein
MKQAAVIATVMLVSITAYAGKADREYMKNTVMPAVKKATDAVKKSCGCAMTITVNESTIKTENDMSPARYIAESVADGVAGYCTDDASKKAVCQMKTLEITKAAEAVFTFKGSKGVASTDGQSHVSFEMITRELDK